MSAKKSKKSITIVPWKLGGLLVALLAIVGGFFFMGGDLSQFFGNEDDPNDNNTTTTTTNDDDDDEPDNPTGKLSDYLPTQALGDKLVRHQYYTVSYATKNKNPEWVAYELTAQKVSRDNARRRDNFVSDPGVEGGAKDSDYSKSGYDRGHLAPAEDMDFSEKAMEESFFLSNISPQEPDFNRGVWKKLENHVRGWAADNKSIYVVTGPVLRKRMDARTPVIGEKVEVPRQFYKVILDYNAPERKGIAFLLDNEKSEKTLATFACSIQKIEEITGINFFPKLSKSESATLEGKFDVTKWKLE